MGEEIKGLVIFLEYWWKLLGESGQFIIQSGGDWIMIVKGAAGLAFQIAAPLFSGYLLVLGFAAHKKPHFIILAALLILVIARNVIPGQTGG